jgi:dipeptidyl aminopeptidase/acylaminoacyl peptidase
VFGTKPGFEQFYAVQRFHWLGNVAFSPDSRHVAYTHDGSGQFNLWRQAVGGGWPWQLTVLEEESARHHAWTPHGFVLGIDRHGDEQWQLHRLPEAGGWPEDVTRRTDAQFVPGHPHPDGERLSFSGNGTRATDIGVYALHVPSCQVTTLLEDEGRFYAGPWHPDGRRLAVLEFHGNTDQDLWILDAESGRRTPLTPHEGEEFNLPVGFAADGRSLFAVTDRGHDHHWLARWPLDGGEPEAVWRGPWGVEHADLDRSGRRLAWTVNEDGLSRFFARDLDSGEDLAVPELPSGWCLHFALSPDGGRVAAVVGTVTRPFDVYVAELGAHSATRLTHSFLGGIPETELVEPELVRYPTFDGRQVPAWLYRPRGFDGRRPGLVSIHGGPESQERPGNSAAFALYQYLVSRGVAVLAPNIRGSTGYGRSYQRLIHRDWGGGDLRDIEASARYLHGLEWVDADRLAVYGGSYGGFATLSALTRLPEYWACGVDVVGPANLVTFLRGVPPFWRESMKRWLGDPDQDRETLMERSPITYVDRLRAPLLVLQGANDPRVVRGESDQMVERLRALGRQVEYHVFEDEGHGFTKRANQQRAYRLITDFLFRHLGVEAER